jgi:hypothetical protein
MTWGVLHASWFSLIFKIVILHLITYHNLPCKWRHSQCGNTTIIPAVLTSAAPCVCLLVDVGRTGNTPCNPRSCVIVYTIWHSYTIPVTGNEVSDVCPHAQHYQPMPCVFWICDNMSASIHTQHHGQHKFIQEFQQVDILL